MNFKTVSIVKHPVARVWTMMRDDLPGLVSRLEDIEGIIVEQYEMNNHLCRVVNVWTASPRLPRGIVKYLDSDMFSWTDRAEWNEETMECLWSIEPHFFRGKIGCSGSTRFEPAMGGRGTKITFSGDFACDSKNLTALPDILRESVYRGVEVLMGTIIPKNFRKITDALSQRLGSNGRG